MALLHPLAWIVERASRPLRPILPTRDTQDDGIGTTRQLRQSAFFGMYYSAPAKSRAVSTARRLKDDLEHGAERWWCNCLSHREIARRNPRWQNRRRLSSDPCSPAGRTCDRHEGGSVGFLQTKSGQMQGIFRRPIWQHRNLTRASGRARLIVLR